MLRLAEEYSSHGKNLAGQGQTSVKGAHNQDSLQLAEADLKVRFLRIFQRASVNADQSQDTPRAFCQLYIFR